MSVRRVLQDHAVLVPVACIAAIMACAGCGGAPEGPPVGAVTGQVTFEGKPVQAGQVSFVSDKEGRLFTSNIQSGGYKLVSQFGNGIPVGTYNVRVTPPAAEPASLAPAADEKPKVEDAQDIPKKYRDPATSGLTAEVKAGPNTLNFDMKP
jgi:hypothetical protein